MEPGHGTRLDPALKAVAHDEVGSLAQLVEKTWDVPEVVAVVSISHQNVLSCSSRNPSHERISISLGLYMDHTGTEPFRDFDRTVGASVVRNDDLSGNLGVAQPL